MGNQNKEIWGDAQMKHSTNHTLNNSSLSKLPGRQFLHPPPNLQVSATDLDVITYLTSGSGFLTAKSHAEAWHTTLLPSVGFSSIDLVQYPAGNFIHPIDVKNSSAFTNIAVILLPYSCFSFGEMSRFASPRNGKCYTLSGARNLQIGLG